MPDNKDTQPDVSQIPVPTTAGTGQPNSSSKNIAKNSSVSSSSVKTASLENGPFSNLNAKIENRSGFDMLKFHLAPGASVITNQDTLSYMDGGLSTDASTGSGGFFSAILRGFTGSSMLQNVVVNSTQNKLQMVLSPLTQGSIIQVEIKAGETWRFSDKSFIACTPNLNVSGNMNIFSNFTVGFITGKSTYTTVSSQAEAGIVWISGYGAVEIHDVKMGTGSSVPLFINNGCFLGMIDRDSGHNYWEEYVKVDTPTSLLNAMFTQIGLVMKIQDTVPSRGEATCRVLTQSLNPHNFEKYVSKIAHSAVESSRPISPVQSQSWFGFGPQATYTTVGTGAIVGATAVAAAAPAPTAAAAAPAPAPTANAAAVPSYSSTTEPAIGTTGFVPQNTANGSSSLLFGPPDRNTSGSNSGSIFRGGRRRQSVRKQKGLRKSRRN